MSTTAYDYTVPVRYLTPAQRGRLDGIAAQDEVAKVIGWSERHEGPLVLQSNGKVVVITLRGRKVTLVTR